MNSFTQTIVNYVESNNFDIKHINTYRILDAFQVSINDTTRAILTIHSNWITLDKQTCKSLSGKWYYTDEHPKINMNDPDMLKQLQDILESWQHKAPTTKATF